MEYTKIPRTCYPQSKIEEDSYDWWERHAFKKQQAAEDKYDLIFIGDSLTHFWHDEQGRCSGHEEVWQEFYSKRKVLNLGFGFDRPQNVLFRLDNGEFAGQDPKAVVLNIGTNCFSETARYGRDSAEVAFAGIKCVIERIFELAPQTHLILMELFPRLPEWRQELIDKTNEYLRKYAAGDERITTVSLYDKLSDNGVVKTELYKDKQTHLNNAGYRIWAETLEPYLAEYIN